MFLEKLAISKKQLIVLGIVSLIFIAALVVFITVMDVGVKDSYTDLDFLGYKFTASAEKVDMRTPIEGDISIEINDETLHELEALSEAINSAHTRMLLIIRNAMIFIYLLFLIFLLSKNKETYLQGIVRGFLIGAALMLLMYTINGILDLQSYLISFEHHLEHMLLGS